MPEKRRRGRPRKNTTSKSQEEIAFENISRLLNFNQQLNSMGGFYTPDMLNSVMKDMNMNPLNATAGDIDKALQDPKNHERELRGISEFFEYTSMIYKRLLAYSANMLSFDFTYVCTNALTIEDYQSTAYRKDYGIMVDLFDKFNVKQEFNKVMNALLRQESCFSVLRDDGYKYTLQELPIDYCKITSRSDFGSFLFDFDMNWFSQAGVDINMYPNIFYDFLNRINSAKKQGYDPSSLKRDGSFAYWVQTSPRDDFWAWKLNPNEIGSVPMYAPLFADLVLTPYIRNLQKTKYNTNTVKILLGLFGTSNDSKNGYAKNKFKISPEDAMAYGKIIKKMNNLPDNVGFGTAPFDDVKSFEFNSDNTNILNEHNLSTISMAGVDSRLLYSSDKQNNISETKNSLNVDQYMMTAIYPYFDNFMNYQINKRTKKYKFKIKFEGTNFQDDREWRYQKAVDLMQKGIATKQLVSSALGYSPFDMGRMMMEAKAEGFVDSLTPIQISSTMSSKDGDKSPGREEKDENDLSNSGAVTRGNGSNLVK